MEQQKRQACVETEDQYIRPRDGARSLRDAENGLGPNTSQLLRVLQRLERIDSLV
jgi:hypothetical protein